VYHFYVGLDLGQSSDYTALALIEEPLWLGGEEWKRELGLTHLPQEGWVSPASLTTYVSGVVMGANHRYGRPQHPPLHLRHLRRYELGTKYTAIVEDVRNLMLSSPIREHLKRSVLLVDKTGVGAAVVDGFWAAGVRPFSITIHGGSNVSWEPHGARVPKRDLVSAAQTLLQSGRLKVAEGLSLAPVLKKELLNFRIKVDPRTAHDSYEHWRENDHDDLVLATSLACWFRENRNASTEQAIGRRRHRSPGGRRVA
jgi:hypothetical protein